MSFGVWVVFRNMYKQLPGRGGAKGRKQGDGGTSAAKGDVGGRVSGETNPVDVRA